MVKVPALFFLTLAVTLPSLYVFNALIGSRLTLVSVLRLLLISLAVMLTVLASLGPIVAFFSASTTSYPFMLMLNVVVFAAAGTLGLRYMRVTLNRLSDSQDAIADVPVMPSTITGSVPLPITLQQAAPGQFILPDAGPLSHGPIARSRKDTRLVFSIWMIVFGLVGGQMAWVLRPFLGRPHTPFTFFRGREASFFEAIVHITKSLIS